MPDLRSFPYLSCLIAVLCIGFPPSIHAKADQVWKCGTMLPRQVGFSRHFNQTFVEGVTEVTQGQIDIKMFWGAMMGDDPALIQKMAKDELQACGLGGQGTLMICPEMSVLTLPFLFNDFKEVDYVKTQTMDYFEQRIQTKGAVPLLFVDQGFDCFHSSKFSLAKLEEFQKARFINYSGQVEKQFLSCLSPNTIPCAISEGVSAFKSGQGDAFLGPPAYSLACQLYSKVRYINTTRVRYTPALFVVSQRTWERVEAPFKKEIRDRREEWSKPICVGSRRETQRCLEAMFQYGVKEVKMAPQEIEEMRRETQTVQNAMAGEVYSQETLDLILGHLEDYRASLHP